MGASNGRNVEGWDTFHQRVSRSRRKGYETTQDSTHSEGDEHAGHHAVFEEGVAEPLGFISHDELSEYASKHLGVNPDAVEDTEESLEGEGDDGTENLKVAAREARRRAFFLSEAVRKGRIDNQRASELAEAGKITLADYIRGQEAERLIESAIAAGKILPRDRAFFFHDALERPKEFQE